MHCRVAKPLRLLTLFALVFLLGISPIPLRAQDAPTRKLSWAAKVQAYQPLSWLAEPLNGEKDFPLTPRFWTGEVELGFSERSSVQVSVGVRYSKRPWLNPETSTSEDFAKGIKLSLAFRNYLLHLDQGQKTGLYIAPTVRFLTASRAYVSDLPELNFNSRTQTLSTAVNLGWQLKISHRLLLDFRAGPEWGYMTRIESYGEPSLGDPASSFDHAGIRLRKIGTSDTKSIWLGLDAAIGVGFVVL
jgi:hypothetical protein